MKSFVPILFSAALLAGCASYQASPLYNLSPELVETSSVSNGGVSLAAKTFTPNDCAKFLDRDVIGQGYQPIQLYIQNDSDRNYLFSLDRISLPVAKAEQVADRVHTSTAGRVVGYGVGALFLWPLAIPAIIDGIKSSEANGALDLDFESKAAKDQIIFARSRANSLLFVPKGAYQSRFTITLIDQESKKHQEFQLVAR